MKTNANSCMIFSYVFANHTVLTALSCFLHIFCLDSAKKIVMAVKAGGGADPEKNRQLAQVIADAKVNNVPRDVIERQLSKANAATTIGQKHRANFSFPLPNSICLHTQIFCSILTFHSQSQLYLNVCDPFCNQISSPLHLSIMDLEV